MPTSHEPRAAAAEHVKQSPALEAEVETLNHITRIAIDANTLYGEAAASAKDAELKATLVSLAEGRKGLAERLQKRVASLGGKPAETGQAIGAVHRSFTAARELVQDNSIAAAGEVYRGESYMIDELDVALKRNQTPISRNLLSAALADVRKSRDRVEAIQKRLGPAPQ